MEDNKLKMPLHNKKATRTCKYTGGFSSEELDKIDEYVKKLELKQASTGINGVVPNSSVRDSKIRFMSCKDLPWFSVRMHQIVDKVNKDWFKVHIEGFNEGYQYTEYYGKDKGHYNWHVDSHGDRTADTRKLSMTLMLSDYEDYKGGAFQHRLAGNIETVKLNRGDILIFPSYALHKVKPVISGTRRTIVSWVGGSQWI